jgi:diadenosine tetraphosphate (Ap4A) HIT family hydrolase
MPCIFCDIVAGRAPASFVHRDERVSAFMTLQPTAAGECLVIPNEAARLWTTTRVCFRQPDRVRRLDLGPIS